MFQKRVICAFSGSFWNDTSSWLVRLTETVPCVIICVWEKVSDKIKTMKSRDLGDDAVGSFTGHLERLFGTKYKELCFTWTVVAVDEFEPRQSMSSCKWKRGFLWFIFSLTIIPCTHVTLIQEEHKGKHGLKPIVLSIEWEMLFQQHIALPVTVWLNGRCSRYYQQRSSLSKIQSARTQRKEGKKFHGTKHKTDCLILEAFTNMFLSSAGEQILSW